MRVKLLLLLPLLALAELKDVVVSGKINLLHYVAKELTSPVKEKSKVTENGLVKACKMEPERFFSDILFYVFECHSDVKSISVDLPGSNNYLDGYQVESFDVQMAHTESPQLKHVVSCPVAVNDPTDMSCSTYVLDFFRAAPDIATLESMGMSSKRVIVVEPGFNSGTSSYTTTVEIDTPFSISARTLQPRGRAGILAPEGSGLDPTLNGCDKAEQAQAVWEFPGFKTTGLFKFGVCAVAPDNVHQTWYNVQVNVTRHYSTRLRSLAIVGKELDPPFDPEVQQYTVHVDGKVKEVDLKLTAVDSEASIRVDADKTTHGNDTMLTTVKMHDNDHLKVGEPPQWSRSVSVQLESADGEKTLTYLVHVKQKVSNYSYLLNLSMDNTSCKMNPPKFEVNVTEYSCVFWWTETEHPRVIATMDKTHCPDCTLLIPSAREFPESHLSLQYQTQIKRVHESGDVWTRPFLYGEYHVVPFQVLSADKFTHTTYHIHLERDAPWWMKAATTRTISSWATVLATSMAIFSASNFVALTRMIQFMDLTTEIKGTPDVYNEFANHLKGFNFDPAPYLPDLGLPSMEDVRDMRNKAVQQLKDAFSVGDMKKSGTLVLQYCYALDVEGQLAANGILHTHPEGTKLLLQSLSEAGDMFKPTPEDEEVEKRKLVLNDTKTRTVFGAQGTNTTLRSLRGVQKYAGDVSGDVTKLRSLEAPLTSRRLDGDDKEEKKKKVEGPDSAMLVVQWTQRQWKEFIEKIKAENVTEDDYPNARKKIPCDEHPMADVVPFLFLMHELELIRRMMHTYTGTFLLMFIAIFSCGAAYITYYRTVMMKSQRRVKWLEPGFLSIFVLDCGLIGFTKSAAKIVSQPTLVTFFFWKPERWEVQAFVLAGVVLYPVVFVMLTYLMISEVTKPSDELEEEGEEGQETKKPDEKALKTKMVFNEDVEQWIDPTAREIKVTLEPPIPSWIPVLGEMITSHVRSCIPVLTVDGEPISFRTDVVSEEEKKVKPVVDKEKLLQEAAELEKKLNEELAENATDATKKDRTKRAETIKDEQETLKKIHERAQKHLGTVKSIFSEMGKVQETYCKEVTPGEKGPSGDPTWFPAEPTKPKEGEEEEEEFTFEKRSIFDLLTEWKSVKGREENEVLDAEESFAIRSYIEGHIRREKRLTKYNIMQVGTYKGYMLPKEPFNIVKKKDPNGKMISVRERADPTPQQLKEGAEPCPHWWLPKDASTLTVNGMEYELDEFGPSIPPLPSDSKAPPPPPPPPYIQNSQGQRLVYESGQMGPLWRFLGQLKVGNQEAGVVRWMDEPEDGWEVFQMSDEAKQKDDKGKKYANMVYADKWQWIYLDKWDLPWSGDDEEEKHLHFLGCWKVAKDDIPLFRIMEKALLKRFKTYVPKQIRSEEKNEIRQWMWKGLLGFTELKLKLGWMAKQHPRYKLPDISEIVTKPFDVFLLELAHAPPDKELKLDSERETDKSEELLNFTLMKFEDLFPDDEEPWWEESDKPADNERKVMFDHEVFFQDSGGDEGENVEFKTRWKENKLIPEHGYYSSSCFTRFPEDTFGKKRYIVKKPDDPVESIARVEINVRLKHVLPLMRYTSHFKACVPINSLELPLRSNLQIILKESGNGEQFNYTVDRLTNLISIGVLASQPPGPVCAITLLLLQMVNFANRFYTNKESAKAVAKLMDEEEAKEAAEEAEKAAAADASEKEPLTGGDVATKKKKLSPMKERIRKKREAMKNKTLMDSFLEVEVFKMFLQSLVLFLLCAGQFGWMPGPICALMCILVCVFTMIFMNVSTFRKEMNKQIESISNSVTEFYRMYRGYENAVMAWLSGENIFGWKFFNFEGAHASNLENISDVNFVVPELGLRLTGKTVVDDLLPQDEKMKQQLLKYTAYFANLRADSRAKVKAASDLQRYHQDIAPSFTLALSVDQLKLCQAIPPIAATIQCVNHAGSTISSPDFDSYYTLYYPEAWEDEHDHDKAAVEQLTNTWKEEVKNWMDDSLGATYSDRTYTKKIQEHIAALMGMPFEHGRSRHCVMIKLEQTLIPDFVPLRTSCREKVFKEMENKMLFVTVLYEDEDFTVDMAYNRTSPLGRIVKLTPEKLDKLMYEGTRPDETSPKAAAEVPTKEPGDGDESPEPPAMMKTKSHFSIRPDMGKLKRFVALLAEEGEEPPIFQDRESLDQFAFICEHEACEFKVPIPATVSKFKLMVWFQNNVDGQPTEELIGFSEPFDLILPDEAALMGEDQADQKRIPFYTSWHTTLTQGLKIIQADDPVEEAKTWFGRLKNQVREYLAPPITKTHVKNSTGFVDMSVRNLTAEELKIDKDYVDAMKDVTVGNSEINKSKLKRHLDRRGILSNFFGLRMEDTCIDGGEETLKAHLKRLEDFYKANQSGWTVELAEKTDMGGRQTKLENLLLAQDIRRSLWKNDDMEKAIESIKQSIEDYEKTKKKEVDANIKIYPRYRITQRYRGPRRVDQESVDFDTAILSELKKFKQDQARTGKSILHYVMVADHLKHNKFWSPDAISPHVCGIIVNNTPDVPSVRLQCHKFNQPAAGEDPKAKISKDMVFHRETLGSSKELPAFVNGRLCFKATDEEAEKYYKAFVPESPETWKVAKKGASEVQEWTPVYLYWDGFARWVVSPFRGEPAPYGLATDTNQNLFLYCRDQATTPDRISKTQFKKWENGMWKEDSSIRVLNRDGSMATKQEANRAEQLRVHAKSVNEDSGSSSWIGEMFKGLMFIFVSTTSKKSSPEIKECLIGLEGGNITIAWKDIHQESLAPLRTFLLDEFTTYQAAWVFLCRNCTIKKTVCVRNLARMLRRSLEGLQAMLKVQERIETQEKRKRMKAAGQMQKTFTNATAAQSSAPGGNEEEEEAQEEEEAKPKEEEKEPEAPAKSTLFSGFGRMMGKAAKSAKAAATGMAGAAKNAASAAAYAAMGPSDEAKRKENEKKMLDYLNRVVTEDPNYVEKICQEIMNQLDHDKDGVLVVKEILALPEVMATKTTNKEMKEFIKFLKVHPAWAKPEFFWAELSEGFEITLEEFTRDSLLLLQRFTKQQEMARAEDAGMSVEERCAKVFAQLDVQMSGGVGLNELIPMSGEDKKAAASNLAKFTVPLTFIKEIRIDKARTSGAGEEERQTVRFQVHPDFENSAEWKKVKKGLSPDWEPNHNFEYLQVAMVPQYLDMWKQVISDCGMDTVQEFVRFYNGSTLEHPVLDGVYMRHGEGTQRWPDGKTYKGYWENHVYEGPGKLFNDYEDMANDVNPIYNGDWKNGKRHGNGVLRWEQDNSDRARKTFGDRQFSGVRKIYDGEFQHDCFHGRGTMRLEKAVSQSLRTMDRQGLSPGRVPLPNMDPSYILSFDGLWESDWTKTDAEAREISPLYENLHPLMPDEFVEAKAHRDLKLDTVTKVERMQNLPHMRFARYFPLDPMEVQAAGDPLPDLALAYYQSKGGDANHMSDGFAVYADFTEYTGFFERGRPSGKGKMTQFDHKDGKKGAELASYDGFWKNGKFEGEGVYTTADGLTYKGSFKEHLRHGRGVETVEEELACKIGYSKYEGNWENGLFHGEGTLTYGDPKGGMGRVFYKGTFVEGKRTGVGRVFDVKDGHLKLLCKFENDKIVTSKSKEEYGWLCLDRRKQDGEGPGKYFYGVIGQDGELGTWGTLYSARAVQDPDFLQCVQEGKPYQKENPQNEQLQYILYHGQWKDSVPDGFGVQHFAGAQMTLEKNPMHQAHGGTYTGDFLNGKRHGRGVWKTTAGAWEFRPIANEDVPNWEKDLMHGIGIVEDFEHVHENVIYTKGKCQMPFTELGPPKTGFESAAFSDVLPQAGRKRIYVTPLPTTENPEEEKKSPEKENPIWVLLKGFGQKLHKQQDEGWEALDREHELAFLRATAKSMGHSAQALTRMNSAVTNTLTMRSMPTSTAGGEPAVAALVREPTDLSLPEEDVLIKGGTGENEVINGVYFKLMHTFGVKAFKMVKQVQSGFYTTTVVRYLYWDHVTSAWTISPKPLGGVCLAPGCAFAQEDNTEHPSMVTKPWYVWHGYTGELLAAGEEIKEKKEDDAGFTLRSLMPEPTPVDKLVAKSIVGFQVQGNQDKLGKIGMGLMLRIPLTLFGRPVYEYEGGGQYLYFHRKKDDGTMEDMAAGQDAELEEFGAGIEPTPERLYESSGCWVIATDMGIELESPDCYAVVEDTAVTPDQITRTWNVRSRDKMEPNVELRFTAQEWSHEGTLQAMVEQVEKEEREAEEAEEEESESQEEKKEKKKEEKTEKKEKKKKGWLG